MILPLKWPDLLLTLLSAICHGIFSFPYLHTDLYSTCPIISWQGWVYFRTSEFCFYKIEHVTTSITIENTRCMALLGFIWLAFAIDFILIYFCALHPSVLLFCYRLLFCRFKFTICNKWSIYYIVSNRFLYLDFWVLFTACRFNCWFHHYFESSK